MLPDHYRRKDVKCCHTCGHVIDDYDYAGFMCTLHKKENGKPEGVWNYAICADWKPGAEWQAEKGCQCAVGEKT